MIDFKKRDLYEREKVRMDNFLNKKLVTESEQLENELRAQEGGGDSEGLASILGGDTIELGSMGDDYGDEGSMPDFGGAGDRSGVKDDMSWQYEGQPLKTFFFSMGHMLRYVFIDMSKDFPKKEEWKPIVKAYNVGNMVSMFLALLELIAGINNIFSPWFQLTMGIIMFITTTCILHFVYEEETYVVQLIKKYVIKKDVGLEDDIEDFDFSDDDSFSMDDESSLSIDDIDSNLGSAFEEGIVEDEGFNLEEDEEEFIEEEREESNGDSKLALAPSSISTDNDEIFAQDLLDAFARNDKFAGKEIHGRVDLIKSFSDYLIQNDRTFGKWKRPRERGIEYNNIAYSLFKGLSSMEQQFGRYSDDGEDEDQMVIVDIRKSPLLFRVEMELPSYFTLNKIQRQIKVLEDVLRKSEDDTEVSLIVTSFRGNLVFKILRLDAKQLVSLGDILRFNDEDKGYVGMEAYDDNKYGLPVLFGLKNNEFPFILDMEANTSGVIVGGSGSGKSWATFELMLNLVTTNDYNNVNFIVLDAKNAPFWNSFARLPHVLGYHTDPMDYIDILREVEDERLRRQDILNELNEEDMKGYREVLREEGNYEKMKEVPLLYVIIDEITATMGELKDEDEELFKTMSNLLGIISQKGRSAGVRILAIGQRSTYDSIPKSLMANSSFKFGMKMNVANDFITLLGDDVKRYSYPNSTGMGLISVEGVMDMHMLKTLTVGGTNNRQMLMLVRVLAFEWVRRSYGLEDFNQLPVGMKFQHSFNRNKFYATSLKEMKEGRILSPAEVSEGYEVILDADQNKKEPGYNIKRLVAAENKREMIEQKNQVIEQDDEQNREDENEEIEELEEEEQGYDNIDMSELSGLLKTDNDINTLGEIEDVKNTDKVINNEKEEFVPFEMGDVGDITNINNQVEDEITVNNESERMYQGDIVNSKESTESGMYEDKEEQENYEIPPSLESILGGSEEDGYYEGSEEEEKSEYLSELLSEEPSESGDIYLKKGEKQGNNGDKYEKDKTSTELHSRVHLEDHLKVPMESHTIPLESSFEVVNEVTEIKGDIEMVQYKKEVTNENKGVSSLDDETQRQLEEQLKQIEKEREKLRREREDFKRYQQEGELQEKEEDIKSKEIKQVKETNSSKAKEERANIVEELNTLHKPKKESSSKDVEIDFISAEAKKVVEPKISVKQYVVKYGVAKGFNVYMSKEDLESVYEKKTITSALNRMAIVETKDGYMTDL